MLEDLKLTWRGALKAPVVTCVAAASLAVGIGASVAVFSVLDACFLRPLGFSRPGEIVRIEMPSFSYPQYVEMRQAMPSIAGLVAVDRRGATLRDDQGVSQLRADVVSPNYFDVLGVHAAAGRLFAAADESVAAPGVVISQRLWHQRFGGDRAIVGSTIQLSERAVTVLGVTPVDFVGTSRLGPPDVWYPAATWAEHADPDYRAWSLMGRLQPNASVARARVEAETFVRRLQVADAATHRPAQVVVLSELQSVMDHGGRVALLVVPVMLLVLLVACSNVAGLLLARSEERRRDTALRLVLGCSRSALARTLLVESCALATLGAGLGITLAYWGLSVIRALLLSVASTVGLTLPEPHVDRRALAFALALTFLATVAAGLGPALRAVRADLAPLFTGLAGLLQLGQRRFSLRRLLIAAQVAVAVVLVSVAGLFANGFLRGLGLDLGFARKDVLAVDLCPALGDAAARTYYDALTERLTALPGVRQIAFALRPPLGLSGGGYARHMFPRPGSGEAGWDVKANMVSSTYFETLGIAIQRGRTFTAEEDRDGRRVMIVSEAMARRFWRDEDPLGRWIRVDDQRAEPYQILGVARDVRIEGIGETPEPYAYLPFGGRSGDLVLLVSPRETVGPLAAAVRQAMRDVNPTVSPLRTTTLDKLVSFQLLPQRVIAGLLSVLGVLAAVLATAGLVAAVSYSVSRRTRELGIRAALGAEQRDNLRVVVQDGLLWATLGIAAGVPVSIGIWHLARSVLYGTSAADAVVLAGVAVVALCVVSLASYLPARRAARVDPMVALRCE